LTANVDLGIMSSYFHTFIFIQKISYPMKQNYLILYHLGVLNPDKEEFEYDEYD